MSTTPPSYLGAQDVWVTNCTFTMSGDGVALGCEQAFVNNNTFYGNADTNAPTGFGCNGGQSAITATTSPPA